MKVGKNLVEFGNCFMTTMVNLCWLGFWRGERFGIFLNFRQKGRKKERKKSLFIMIFSLFDCFFSIGALVFVIEVHQLIAFSTYPNTASSISAFIVLKAGIFHLG